MLVISFVMLLRHQSDPGLEPQALWLTSPMSSPGAVAPREARPPTRERPVARDVLIAVAFAFLALFLLLPLVVVFVEAFSKGVGEVIASAWRPRHVVGDPADAAGRRHRGAAATSSSASPPPGRSPSSSSRARRS